MLLPKDPPGWKGPFLGMTFIDGSQVSCKPSKTKQNVMKLQSMASKSRKKTLQEALEFTTNKKLFEETTFCPANNIRAIVGNGKSFSIRGTSDENIESFNEETGKEITHKVGKSNKKMIVKSKDEFIYIKDEYYV